MEIDNIDLPEVELASILTSHHTESDPYTYEIAYDSLKKFSENSLDMYKVRKSLSKSYQNPHLLTLRLGTRINL